MIVHSLTRGIPFICPWCLVSLSPSHSLFWIERLDDDADEEDGWLEVFEQPFVVPVRPLWIDLMLTMDGYSWCDRWKKLILKFSCDQLLFSYHISFPKFHAIHIIFLHLWLIYLNYNIFDERLVLGYANFVIKLLVHEIFVWT